MITQAMIDSDVSSQYTKPEEKATAAQAYSIGLAWVNEQPKTWCMSEEKSDREKRRDLRQKRKQVSQQLYDHIYGEMTKVKQVDGVQVVGFGFIAMIVLGAIISYTVQRILSHYFG